VATDQREDETDAVRRQHVGDAVAAVTGNRS